jgi:hypothetical protein
MINAILVVGHPGMVPGILSSDPHITQFLKDGDHSHAGPAWQSVQKEAPCYSLWFTINRVFE